MGFRRIKSWKNGILTLKIDKKDYFESVLTGNEIMVLWLY